MSPRAKHLGAPLVTSSGVLIVRAVYSGVKLIENIEAVRTGRASLASVGRVAAASSRSRAAKAVLGSTLVHIRFGPGLHLVGHVRARIAGACVVVMSTTAKIVISGRRIVRRVAARLPGGSSVACAGCGATVGPTAACFTD